MKTVFTIITAMTISGLGFSQSLNSIPEDVKVPDMQIIGGPNEVIYIADFQDEVTVDMVLDKMREIESFVHKRTILEKEDSEHLLPKTEVVYF